MDRIDGGSRETASYVGLDKIEKAKQDKISETFKMIGTIFGIGFMVTGVIGSLGGVLAGVGLSMGGCFNGNFYKIVKYSAAIGGTLGGSIGLISSMVSGIFFANNKITFRLNHELEKVKERVEGVFEEIFEECGTEDLVRRDRRKTKEVINEYVEEGSSYIEKINRYKEIEEFLREVKKLCEHEDKRVQKEFKKAVLISISGKLEEFNNFFSLRTSLQQRLSGIRAEKKQIERQIERADETRKLRLILVPKLKKAKTSCERVFEKVFEECGTNSIVKSARRKMTQIIEKYVEDGISYRGKINCYKKVKEFLREVEKLCEHEDKRVQKKLKQYALHNISLIQAFPGSNFFKQEKLKKRKLGEIRYVKTCIEGEIRREDERRRTYQLSQDQE